MNEAPQTEPVAWVALLDRAVTADAVMRVVRGYVTAQARELWSSLPIDSQPPPFRVPDDVSNYALALIRKRLEVTHPMSPEMERLSAFFSHASRRLSWVIVANSPRYAKRLFEPRD